MFRVELSGDEEAPRRCQLKGEYNLWVKDSSLCLSDITSSHVLYEWPYVYIRRIGKKRQAFCFEAGRRCSSGEGVFTMKTDQYIQLFQFAKEKTTWKSPTEHATLQGKPLDGCRDIPAYENLPRADDSEHTYVNLNSLREQGFAGLHEDKVVGVYSEPYTTGTYLTAVPDKQEHRRSMSNVDTLEVNSSKSEVDHVYSEAFIT